MIDANRGYVGYSKSVRAERAEEAGARTLSKITASWLKAGGVQESLRFVTWLIRIGEISASEWHHTSKYFNVTYYYRAEDIAKRLRVLDEYEYLDIYRNVYQHHPTLKNYSEYIDSGAYHEYMQQFEQLAERNNALLDQRRQARQ